MLVIVPDESPTAAIVLERLPREELTTAAEALVSLQGPKQRMSMEVESVSGPIDLLMISRPTPGS